MDSIQIIFIFFISGIERNCRNTGLFYTFNLLEPPGHMINNISKKVLYQLVTKQRIEIFDFSTEDEYGRSFDLNGDVLGSILRLT